LETISYYFNVMAAKVFSEVEAAKVFNVIDPIYHDLTSPNFITLLNSLKSFSYLSFFAS